MMYFINFERAAFDTEGFLSYIEQRARDVKGEHSLTPGELSQFLYEDAGRFLRDKENGVMLIASGDPVVQRAKVESALVGIPRISTIYTGESHTGDYIAPHIRMYGTSPTFVEASVVELEILAATCPDAHLVEIRRDGNPGDGRWQVITSLSELV